MRRGRARPIDARASTTGGFVFARQSLALLLPISVNVSITQVLVPALTAILARTSSPTEAIGGYALALGVMQLLKLPELRVQQLTLVFLEHRGSLPALQRFVGVLATVIAVITVALTLTPLRDPLVERVFAAEGGLAGQAKTALVWLTPLPMLGIIRTFLYGRLLRVGAARLVWVGTASGVAFVLSGAAVLVSTGLADGAAAAAIAVSTGAALEVLLLLWLNAHTTGALEAADGRAGPTQREMLAFFAPLLLVAALPAITYPLANATVARSPEPEASLAGVAAAYGAFQVVAVIAHGVQSTALALFATGARVRWIIRFCLGVGFVTLLPTFAILLVPGLDDLVFRQIMGVDGRLFELTVVAFLIFAILPPFLTWEQLYAAALMRLRRTGALLWINLWRLLALLLWVSLVPALTSWTGVIVGAGAITSTLVLEALLTHLYARGSMRELLEGERRAAAAGSPVDRARAAS